MYSYLLNLTIEASRLIAKQETMVVSCDFQYTRNDSFFTFAIKRNRTSAILGCKLLVAVFTPPTSPVLLPALVPPDFTKQSLVCTLLLHRSNVEATRVPACRERRQMPVKWPALQSLAQTRTGFQTSNDAASTVLVMTSNTVNSLQVSFAKGICGV